MVATSLMGLTSLLSAGSAKGSVVLITSISEIRGTTINFEQPGGTANAILPGFDMIAIPDTPIITLIPAITGNSSAPISDRALFSEGFLIETTGLPWVQIGLTGVGTQSGEKPKLTVIAFDKSGLELGSITRVFAPVNSSISAYNEAAVFLGLGSTTPIQAIELLGDSSNVAWDNLRFNSVPEPSSILLLGCGLAAILLSFGSRMHGQSGRRFETKPKIGLNS